MSEDSVIIDPCRYESSNKYFENDSFEELETKNFNLKMQNNKLQEKVDKLEA